jgi:macrolide transport system ATP-binding/permease protein
LRKNLLLAENISMSFGTRTLFHIEKLEVFEGDRIGLVGLNGSGKSTLLRLINGDISPDEGRIKLNCTPRYFTQLSGNSSDMANPKELSLFGVEKLIHQETVSGGERTRLRLAELFSENGALFLLDEPTSHLDEEGAEYLDQRLAVIDSFILVSHDRALLDRQCNTIIEIEDGNVRTFLGNYSSYIMQKQQAFDRASFEYEQYTEEVKRLSTAYQKKKEQAKKAAKRPRGLSSSEAKATEFSAPTRSPKSKAKSIERSAEGIKRRIEHMEVKEKPREMPKIRPVFSLTDPPRNPIVLEADHLSFSYPNGKEIFRDTTFRLMRDSRTVLLGENGSGKTTLIRLILEGKLIRAVPKAKIGYLKQDLSDLRLDKTVLENTMETSIQSPSIVRTILARLLFSAQDIRKPVSVLSGGERVRLSFARIFVSNANVLILDEPTNYLDIPSIEAVQALLSEYEGTMLFTSHDQAFVNAIATDAIEIRDKQIMPIYL